MTDFAKLLNPEQFAAATAGDGPLLVLAAAGTGKTRTLVHRVAYLAENGVPPSRMMLLTFTNRAAREMLERARAVAGPAVESVWSGTFHSVCARLLRIHGHVLGYTRSFRILDEDDRERLVGEIIKETVANPRDFAKKDAVVRMISDAVNERRPVAAIAARQASRCAGADPEAVAAIAAKYEARKRELDAMDFDDLLSNGLALLKAEGGPCEALQERFLHVLVDEYQDTNALQAEFTDILAARHRNIMAVGDDFQCIYTWRGARIENIMDFPRRWEGCRIVKLERNYRSQPGILDVANAVMKDASGQFGKTLRAYRPASGALPAVYRGGDGRAQAQEILRAVEEALAAGHRRSDIAILYRSHFHSIEVQLALARRNVPHRITSGTGVFEQVHVKDLLAYLRLLGSYRDELSFLRFVMLFPGVGEVGAKKFWKKLGGSFDASSAASLDALGEMFGAKARPLWPAVRRCFEDAAASLEDGFDGRIVENFCDAFYAGVLRSRHDEEEAADRLDDLREIAVQISETPGGLPDFLADVALYTNLDARKNDPDEDKITLSTVHQAKGMEWPVVIVPWCSEGMFPSSKAAEEGRIDEERRLFYVAVTRAKDDLKLFSPQTRRTADGGVYPVDVSVFLRDVPRSLVDAHRIYPLPEPSWGGRSGYGGSTYGNSAYGGSRYGSSNSNWKTTWRR